MKKIFIPLFLFCIYSTNCLSQLNNQEGSIKTKYIPNSEFTTEVNTIYYFGKSKGLVVLLDPIDRVTINESRRKQISSSSFSEMSINFDTKETVMYKKTKSNKSIRTIGKLSTSNWEIDTTKSKKIGFYNCYKASYQGVNGTSTVWFTKEIDAISPGGVGLPGLILESEDKYGKMIVTEIKLEPQDKLKFELTDGELVSNDKFFKTKSKTVKLYEKAVKATDAAINKE